MNVPSSLRQACRARAIPPATPGGRGAVTACRPAAIDRAAGTPCSIVRCVTRCMIRLRHDLKDGTTVPDQNYRNQGGAICAVRHVEPRACRANGSARNAVARFRFAVRNVAPRLQPTPSFALIAARRLPLSHGRALIRLRSYSLDRERDSHYTRAGRCCARHRRRAQDGDRAVRRHQRVD